MTAKAKQKGDALSEKKVARLVGKEKEPDVMIELSDGGRPASEIKVAVYGGGSFGTAMACVLGRKGIEAVLVVLIGLARSRLG